MNLLKNSNFDEGHHHQDGIPEIVVPNDWQLYWVDKKVFKGAESVAYRPESVVWNIKDAPEHEKTLFFLSGNYCWKVFKANAPVYFAATQVISGLTPGGVYRFNAQVFPDIVTGYSGGKKVRPGDIWAAEARAGWSAPATPWPESEDGDVTWGGWFNKYSKNFEFGVYNTVWVEFTAPEGGEVRLWLECKAKWGFANNWFMDSFSLEQVGGATTPSTTPPSEIIPAPPFKPVWRGAPRMQFKRTYILLPKNISADLALAAMRVAHAAYVTVGFSPDDAGMGDLDVRRVICVFPDKIEAGIDQAWYDTYYPGVKFVAVTSVSGPDDLAAQLQARLSS
ncbi:MAG: hypothetical protein JXA21_00475 [Anaerolineae bacterium]|nr:hypothetical protein [Anaerolineae bacterium]